MSDRILTITIKVRYSEKTEKILLQKARELGYDYGDAGPLKTVARSIVSEGLVGIFPEEILDQYEFSVTSSALDKDGNEILSQRHQSPI